jgi:uncharacterized repeat protein (TIGR01451 family)
MKPAQPLLRRNEMEAIAALKAAGIRSTLLAAVVAAVALTAAAPASAATSRSDAGVFEPSPSPLALAASADLSVTSSDAPDPVAIGQDLIYSITVQNGGPDPATAAQLVDPLPSGVTFVNATTDVGTCGGGATGTVTCDLGDLPANGVANVVITVNPTAAVDSSITNTVTVASATDTNAANDQATTDTAILPDLTTGDATVTEGDSGTTDAVFTVSLSHATSQAVSFHYATADLVGGAKAGTDYVATSGDATIPAGQTSTTVSVPVIGDTIHEATPERFQLNVSAVSHATLLNGDGIGNINDQDEPPTISIADAMVNEGNSGTTNATFTVSLSAANGRDTTVHYATADGTATQPGDYTATSGDVTIPEGQTSKAVTVPVKGDTTFESDESFTVTLSAPTDATIGATIADGEGTGTIVNDDSSPGPALSIGDATIAEGNAGTVNQTFTVSTAVTSSSPISFTYTTSNATASAGSDYTATTATGTIPAGQTSTTVSVPVRGDTLDEPDETYAVDLSGVSGADVLDGHAVGTIVDDDVATTPSDGGQTSPSTGGSSSPSTGSPSSPSTGGPSSHAAPAVGASVFPHSLRIGRICGKRRHGLCRGVSGKTTFGASSGRVRWDLSAALTMRSGGKPHASMRRASLRLGHLERTLSRSGKLTWQVKVRAGVYAKLARRFFAAKSGQLVVRITYRPLSGSPTTKVLRIRLRR